jgi:uncharacterized protein (TIGR02246 family)
VNSPSHSAADECDIRTLLDTMCTAWNRGDAKAFSERYREDGTFTNVFGTVHFGRDEFERRHADVFVGFLKDTRIAMSIEKLRLVRPDVAVADIDMVYSDFQNLPRGVAPMPDGRVHSSLLMVLTKHGGEWWISAYHNIWRVAAS